MSQSFLCHSRHCGLCTSINKPHQTFRETNRSYGLGTSFTQLKDFRHSLPLSAVSDQVPLALNNEWTKLNADQLRRAESEQVSMSKSVPCPTLRCPSYVSTVWHVGTKNTTSYTVCKNHLSESWSKCKKEENPARLWKIC